MEFPYYCYVHGGCRKPCCNPCNPPIYPCNPPTPPYKCQEKPVIETSSPHILSLSSDVVTYNANTLAYYSIGVNDSVLSTSPPGVVTTAYPISFLFNRSSKILKLVSQFSVASNVTLTGNLTVSAQIYNALKPLNGAQMTYANLFTQQIATLTGAITAGSTYTYENTLCLPIQENSSIVVIFSVVDTVAEEVMLKFSAALSYS